MAVLCSLMAFALSCSFFCEVMNTVAPKAVPFGSRVCLLCFFCITSKTQPSKCSSSSTVHAALGLLLLSLHRSLYPPKTHLFTGMLLLLLTDDDDDDAPLPNIPLRFVLGLLFVHLSECSFVFARLCLLRLSVEPAELWRWWR